MNDIEVAVYMPDAQAKKFLQFQQFYPQFSLLLEKKVFEQKNASVIMHFDSKGGIQLIERHDFLFNARFPG
jgi:hypothetical protein